MERTALQRRRIVRRAGWLGFAGILLLGEMVIVSDVPPQWRQAGIDAITYLLPILLALVAAIIAALRTQDLERRVWVLMAVASGLLMASETYICFYIDFVDWRGPQLPASFELLQAGAVLAILSIFWTMTSFGDTPLSGRARIVVDILCAFLVALAATYWWLMLPLYGSIPGAGWPAAAVTAVYPIVGVFLLGGTVLMLLGGRRFRWRGWERLLATAFGLYGVGLIFEPQWYAANLKAPFPAEGGLLSAMFGFGYYLLFMALVYRLTAPAKEAGVERWPLPRPKSEWLAIAYPSVVACALPFMALASLRVGHEPEGGFIVWLTVALGVGLIARTWLSDRERSRLRDRAITDPISGAFNFRYLHERLAEQLTEAKISAAEPSLVVFDIDDFSRINAMWGHDTGDQLLRRIAELIGMHLEPHMNVYRVGGDEFALLLNLPFEQAVAFAKHVQARIALTQILANGSVSVSAGIAVYPRHGQDVEQLLAHAHAAQQLSRMADTGDPVVYDDEVVGSVDPIERLARARRRAHRATVRTLASAVDARDPAMRNHSENVAELATSLATVLGMPTDQIRIVRMAAQMHDVGKIGIRDEVLQKAEDSLTADERRHVEEHPALGERILAPAQLDAILPAVRHHHERWDGTGYPDGLRGPQIPVGARILAVCDVFDAMTSARPFRQPIPLAQALREVENAAGTQFDPEVAATFVRMVGHLRSPVATDPA